MKYFSILFLCFIMTSAAAQTGTFINRLQTPLSPSENRFNSIQFDMDIKHQQQLYANPVFYEIQKEYKQKLSQQKYKSAISAGYANGNLDGDFLLYEGNEFNDFRIMAAGEYSIKSSGTLFGSVQYAKGIHKNMGWNAVRYAELYRPYFSTDSIGGDFNFEDYQVSGGYAFRLNDLFLGIYGSFHGEQAHRKTDPRALNNTTWLSLGAGAGKRINNHLIMLQGGFARNKQSMEIKYWRPGQQDRFFVGYGFGLYDVRLSAVSFGYSRMHYINEGVARFIYQSPVEKKLSLYSSLGYKYDYMKTEEKSIKDLYHSKTHHLNPTIRIDWKTTNSLSFSLLVENLTDSKKGYENIFEQYLVDEANNLYDFRLIDIQQKYTYTKSESQVQIKINYQLNSQHLLELMGGVSYFIHEEKYDDENYKLKNTALFPHGGIGYKMNQQKSEFSLSALYIKKVLSGNNTYDVTMKNQNIEHLDFQHAFSPWAYYNSTYSCINLSSTYVYHLKKYGIGINARLMYKTGERDNDATYTEKVGFDSSAPRLSTTPDKHDEIWFTTALFFVF